MPIRSMKLYRGYALFCDGELHFAESADEEPGAFLQLRSRNEGTLTEAVDELHACGNTSPDWLGWGPGPETYIDLDAR